MFYFLLVSYDIPNLMLNETSELFGPYETAEARDKGIADELADDNRDLETGEIYNVTKLEISKPTRLVSTPTLALTASYIASDPNEDEDEEEEFDDEDDG